MRAREVSPDVVQHHDDHDQPAQQVYVVHPPPRGRGGRDPHAYAVRARWGVGGKNGCHRSSSVRAKVGMNSDDYCAERRPVRTPGGILLPMTVPTLRRVTAGRYVQPLREGGSLPAVVDTDDGACTWSSSAARGRAPRALVAELLVGLLAGRARAPVPELALVELPPPFGRSEPDPEIQDLLRRSHGLNVGLRYLDGAFNFDGAAAGRPGRPRSSPRALVWLDALVDQSRPDPPQPQPAGLAAPPLADRPRRRALRPSRLGRRDRRAGAGTVPAASRDTCCWRAATDWRRWTQTSAAARWTG